MNHLNLSIIANFFGLNNYLADLTCYFTKLMCICTNLWIKNQNPPTQTLFHLVAATGKKKILMIQNGTISDGNSKTG